MKLIDFIDTTFNYKKLRRSRVKRGYSILDVAKKTGIPRSTLQKYETGTTKDIPVENLKKICELYNTDPTLYYGWSAIPFFSTFSGIIVAFIYGVPYENTVFNGMSIGFILGILGMKGAAKYFTSEKEKSGSAEKLEDTNPYDVLYNKLSTDEKKAYEKFKKHIHIELDSDAIFTKEELAKEDYFLLAYYFGHKIKSEENYNPEISPYTINHIEKIELVENEKPKVIYDE